MIKGLASMVFGMCSIRMLYKFSRQSIGQSIVKSTQLHSLNDNFQSLHHTDHSSVITNSLYS